jgi:hypothetical protein
MSNDKMTAEEIFRKNSQWAVSDNLLQSILAAMEEYAALAGEKGGKELNVCKEALANHVFGDADRRIADLEKQVRELDLLLVPDKWEINQILFAALKDEKLAGELTYKIAALHQTVGSTDINQ